MNKDVEVEARPRPLSTGLWTLFSWLRRDDRSSSSESLSSAGSDRTAASFAFLAPTHYETPSDPIILPPSGPPTDTYKKRVHDRNLRRQYDRDLTLHRKYGLFKSEVGSYDAFSLPPVRRVNGDISTKWDRERRAASECLQRRAVYVPGKRRAPAPPVIGSSNSLPRRHSRKRPAPQPPGKFLAINKENKNLENLKTILTQMNSDAVTDKQKPGNNDVMMGCKSEKYSKKDPAKDVKLHREKSFLKQIFDNKKRHSAIDTSSIKVLPNISELDKQAADIIEACKTNPSEHNNNVKNVLLGVKDSKNLDQAGAWFCVSCLRKYNSTVAACLNCFPNGKLQALDKITDYRNVPAKASNSSTQTEKGVANTPSSSKKSPAEEKQKLKEMLKEMKDSLPKRPKHDQKEMKNKNTNALAKQPYTSTETPTLRVGSTQQTTMPALVPQSSEVSVIKTLNNNPVTAVSKQHQTPRESVLITQQVVIAHNTNIKHDSSKIGNKDGTNKDSTNQDPVSIHPSPSKPKLLERIEDISESENTSRNKTALNTPLKVSSLLNPVYVPKVTMFQNAPQNITQITPKPQISKMEVVTPNSAIKSSEHMRVSTSSTVAPKLSIPKAEPNQTPNKIDAQTNTKEITTQKDTSPINLKNTEHILLQNKNDEKNQRKSLFVTPSTSKENKLNRLETQDQHSKRRDLINQLEQSIAKGDERAAAEAAAKLAQLRLSCSVLSFTSQILSQASTSATAANTDKKYIKPNALPLTRNEPNQINQPKNLINLSHKVPISNIEKSQTKQVSDTKLNSELKKKTTIAPHAPQSNVQLKPLDQKEEASKEKSEIHGGSTTKNFLDKTNQNNMISIPVLVEDREATRGPVHLRINRLANMRDLRREAETSLGLATNLQRWIIGRTLCTNDDTPVASLAAPDFSAPFYLCLVESETKIDTIPRNKVDHVAKDKTKETPDKGGNVYSELVQLEQQAVVPNPENFECGVCMEEYGPGRGVVLRDCVHIFCKECLTDVVRHCEDPDVPCPAMGCRGMLQEREIRAIVTAEDYERWLARGLAAAESGTRNAFHCRTKDCKGWALCEPGVQRFPCPVCKCINCVPCQAIHDGVTCEQHRTKLKEDASTSSDGNQADDGTRTLLKSLISKGEALECPECKAIITKKWGCDWVKCSACKTEICWVTRGRRWGPAGRGDTSGGCRCGVDGKRCHPSCGYCH